jgi:hypothetical protein
MPLHLPRLEDDPAEKEVSPSWSGLKGIGQLSHSLIGDSTLFSRCGCGQSFHHIVSPLANYEKRISRSGQK